MGTVAVLFIGLAPDWRWLIPAFALHLLSSFSRPAASAHVAATDISDNPSRTFAFLWTGFSLGSLLSPTLGGWIAETWGLRTVFFVAAAVGVVSTALLAGLKDASAPLHHHQRRAGLGELLHDGPFMWQMVLMLTIVFALELGTVLAPNYLRDVKGLSLRAIGQLGSLASLGMFALTIVLGYMRNDRRRPLLLNQGLVLGGLLCLLLAPGGWAYHPLLLASYFFRGGSRAIVPLTRGRLSGWLPPEALSVGFGLVDTAAQTATLLAPLAAGYLFAR
jgi:MFS family permease